MPTYRDTMRKQICDFVNNKATDSQIFDLLDYTLPSSSKAEGEKKASRGKRIPKKARRSMSRSEADSIRAHFVGLERDTPKYNEMRDQLARETGFTRRQVSAAVGGLKSATKRKSSRKS